MEALIVVVVIVAFIAGMVVEHKYDVLTPERLKRAEEARDEIRKWIKDKGG